MNYDFDADPELVQQRDYAQQLHRNRLQHWHPWDPEREDFYDEEDE